jgi:dTDP-4-amino-4,6-dideoxygalactose transaminase
LFAYLFGIRYDISEVAKYCRERNIDVLEDCAQSFQGTARFTGNEHATLTMFSLGMIKIQTTFYGGLSVVRDRELHEKMNSIQETYPAYTKQMFRKRILSALAAHQFINTSTGNKLFNHVANASGMEREDFYVSLSRGFKPGSDFLSRFRFNPCAPLLSFIY